MPMPLPLVSTSGTLGNYNGNIGNNQSAFGSFSAQSGITFTFSLLGSASFIAKLFFDEQSNPTNNGYNVLSDSYSEQFFPDNGAAGTLTAGPTQPLLYDGTPYTIIGTLVCTGLDVSGSAIGTVVTDTYLDTGAVHQEWSGEQFSFQNNDLTPFRAWEVDQTFGGFGFTLEVFPYFPPAPQINVSQVVEQILCTPPVVTPPPPPNPPSLNRYRGQTGINYLGMALVGDQFSGVIGKLDFDTFTEFGNPMRALVTSPPIHSDRKRMFLSKFELDVESGVGLTSGQGEDPVWMLDWSKDGGRTWSEIQVCKSMGRIGEYSKRLRWLRLGQSRQWIMRLQSTDPVRRVIVGVYVDVTPGMD